MKKQQENYADELQKAHDRWNYIYEHGAGDPHWQDGVNLNLVRNHISYYREKIEEAINPASYPSIYYKEIPPKVDYEYMARPDEIRACAKATLEKYKADPNYQYILKHQYDFTEKTRNELYFENVLGNVKWLEEAIKKDDLVYMRLHENHEKHLPDFANCVERMKNAPSEIVQMSMFSLCENY